MSYTFQKWDSVTHPIIEAVDDYNSIVDALNNLLTTLDNINPPSSIIPVPTFSLNVDYEGLGTYDFRCWIKVTIPHTNNASNFVVAYKQSTETIFNTFIVKQEETGDTVALTPILKENTLYDVKVRCIGGTGGIGDFSAIQQITTPANTIAYPVPENVSAYGILNGVIISWDSLDRTYYRYASYNVYHNTVDDFDTATLVGNISGSDYLWNMNEEDEYVPQYFWVTSVSPSGIESNPSTVVYATPIKLTPLNMEISMMPWTANFKIWEDTTTYGTFYWADNTELLDGTIYYADETTATITKNLTGTALEVGLYYAYIEDGNSNLNITEIYGDAVGVGKNLLAIIHVTAVGVDGKPSTIQPYNSYTPTIGAGGIAAKTIRAEHLITDNIILYGTQIADGIINTDHVFEIDAQKILLKTDEGVSFYVKDWADPNDYTKIHGSVIKTGTITNEKILNIEAEKVKINSVGEGVYFNELLDTSAGTTTIKGGAITANSITLDRLEEDAIKTDPYGTTYIDGGKIYTGTITADQITSNWITGKNIRTASTGNRVLMGTYEVPWGTGFTNGIGVFGDMSLLFFDGTINETFCGGIAGQNSDLLIGNPNGKIIIEAAEGSGVIEIAGTISLQNSIDSMFEFRSPLTEISGTDLTDYIWEWKNGIWTPSGKTIPTGNSFLRIKDETTNYATDLFGVIVNHDGYINPLFGVSTGFVVKKDISCGGYIAANQGIFAAGSGLQTQFDPAGVWLIHSGLNSIHDIDQLSSAPANPVEGQYYINTINNHIFYYDGSNWIDKGDADNCTYNFDTFVIRKAGYTKPKPPFATANLPIPSNELGHVMANTLYADNLKKVDGTNWDFEIYDQSLNTTNDVRFNSVSCDLALKVGSWGSQEFSVTVDSSKVYLTSHAARDFYFGNLSGSKSIFQRDVELLEDLDVAGNLYLGSSGYKAIFTVGHDSTYLYLYTTQDYVGLGTSTYPFKWGDFYDLFAQYSLHIGTGTSEIAFTSGIDTGIRYLTPDGTNKTVGLGSANHYLKYVDSDIIYANTLQGLENTRLTIASGTQLSFGNTDVLMYRPTTGDDANTKSIRIQTPSNAGLIVEQNLSSNHLSVTNNAAVGGTLTLGVGTSASSLISGYTNPYTYIYPTTLTVGLGSDDYYFRWINVYDAFIYNYLNLGTGDSATSFGMGYDAPYKYLMPEDTNVGLGSDDYYFRWINVYDAFVNHSINLGSGSAIINFSVGLDAGVRYIILDGSDKTVGIGSTGHALAYVDTEKIYVNEFRKLSDGTLWDFGDSFDQNLNTTNDVKFKSVSVGSTTYPKVKVSDNGIQLGAGTGATFDIALTRETSPSPHLLISKDTQIDGALGVAGINVTGTGGFTSATSSISYIECKVTDDDYPRLRLKDDYIAFGSGSADPTVSLSYETSPSTRLQVNGHFQVTGNANFLNVSATNEIGCALLTLGKIRIGLSYGNEGEVLTSQGYDKAPIWTTPSSWDGGTVTKTTTFNNTVDLQNILRIVRANTSSSYIENKVTGDTYPRIKLIDDYIAFGSGSASPTLTLGYSTTGGAHLHLNGAFQVDGATGLAALNVSGLIGLNNLVTVKKASAGAGHIDFKVGTETYPRLRIIDNYFAFGTGATNPTLTLSYQTSPKVRLEVSGNFQVVGDTSLKALSVSGIAGFSDTVDIQKFAINENVGSPGQVIKSTGQGTIEWGDASTFDGGTVNDLIRVKRTIANQGHFAARVGSEFYDRFQIIDNILKFGSGASAPTVTLSYVTSGGERLLLNSAFQVDGAVGVSSLNVSGTAGISGVLNIAKLTIATSYGNEGQVLTSQGEDKAPIWTTPSSTWNGGTVSNGINLAGIGPELGLRIASYIELGQFINGFNPYIAFNAKQETFSGGVNRLTPRYGEEDFCSMGMFRGETASGTLSYEVYKSGESTTPVSIGNFTKVLTMYDTGKVLFPNTDATYGGIWINDIRLYSWDDNVLGISSFVNIVPPADDAKIDLRAPSNKDAILNLMCGGDVKAVLAYDSSETKTYLAAYASSGTYSQLHLNGSKIVLENATRITGNVLEINNNTPVLNLNLANGANRATFGFDGTTTYISTQSGNLQISPYGNVVITKNIEATTGTTAVNPRKVTSGVEAVYDGPGVLAYIPSSKRYKENIKPITNADWIYELSPVIFNRIGNDVEHKEIGLIAEDVYEIYPQIVNKDSDGRIDNIRYTGLITPLLIEIQNLKKENNVLKTKLAKMNDLEKRIIALENSKIAG